MSSAFIDFRDEKLEHRLASTLALKFKIFFFLGVVLNAEARETGGGYIPQNSRPVPNGLVLKHCLKSFHIVDNSPCAFTSDDALFPHL